ncbi:MAG: peptide chain release factor N(5)-glutamine methyltransferase [Gemmatimonadaceae bacterium]|nr:peptide chain release factor N(5)-glutamine methyltransferase [Gemmatimonadaceae bacterium]
MTDSKGAHEEKRDSGPYVKSLRDVELPADIASAAADAGTIGDALDALAEQLGGASRMPARQEARDVIAAVLGQPKFWPTAHRDDLLAPATLVAISEAAERLKRGMPFQYAVRRADFRSLTLYVDERVLIPRPETELLVELALAATAGAGRIADVGTGSGAIALSLAAEGRYERIIATDISTDALTVARHNLRAIAEDRRPLVEFRAGSWCAPLSGEQLGAVVANPPYIAPTEADELPELVRNWEPSFALFAERDGMAAIRAIVTGAAPVLVPHGVLAMEVDSRRAQDAAALATGSGAFEAVTVHKDLTGRERFVVARRKET